MLDRLAFLQNIESKEFKGKIFGFNSLIALCRKVCSDQIAIRFGEHASMTLLFSFCLQGQGHPSQRRKRVVEKVWRWGGQRLKVR
jgi:hypothetical protein